MQNKENKLFNLRQEQMDSLTTSKIPLEAIYLLELITEGGEVPLYSLKYLQWLERKAYINRDWKITEYGTELYKSMFNEGIVKTKRVVKKDDDFDKWWSVYPATDNFSLNGRDFPGTQSKKLHKEECRKMFNVILNEGLTADDIISATQYIVDNAKQTSIKKNENQMSYIANSERFLRERKFAPFVTIAKAYKLTKPFKKDFEI